MFTSFLVNQKALKF